MTTSLPLQCLACDWLDRSSKQPFSDQPVVKSCGAFPFEIPAVILAGADHRSPVGGEVDGITFALADGEGDYFRAWERLNASIRTASPQPDGEKSLKRTYIRDEEGQFDDVPGVGVDVDLPDGDVEPDDNDEYNDQLPADYLDRYGKVIGSSNLTGELDPDGEFQGDLLESSRFDVVVTENRGFHVLHGIKDPKVVQELDPFAARVLKDTAWDIDDGKLDLPHTDEATGVRFESAAGGDIVVTWADGTRMPIEAALLTDIGEAMDGGVDAFESEFGKRKAATGRRLSIKRNYVRDSEGRFDDVPGAGLGGDPLGVAGEFAGGSERFLGSVRVPSDPASVGVNIVATESDGYPYFAITTGSASEAGSASHADEFAILGTDQMRSLQSKMPKAIAAAKNSQAYESKVDGEDNGDVVIGAEDGKVTVSARNWGWEDEPEAEDLRPPLQDREDFEAERDPDDEPYTYEQYVADHAAGRFDDEHPAPTPTPWKTASLTVEEAQDLLSEIKRLANSSIPKSALHHRDTGSVRASIKRSSTGETMQLKSFQPEVKAVGRNGDVGTATIAIATLGVVDKDGDVTQPGFFGEQHAQMVPVHDWNHVPIGKGRVYEQGNKALVDVTFNLKIPAAKDWYEAIKFDKENPPSLQEFSYGYSVLDGGSKQGNFKGRAVRYLTPRPDGTAGSKVHEFSPVLLGAGEGTGTVDVKSRARERIAERRANAVGGMFKGGLAVHETPTVGRSWDGVKTVAALAEDALPSQLRTVFAWVDPAGDPELKASYQFPHHHGVSGPANIRACLAGIATLNGAAGGCDLSESDRKSVYDHLASHLKDADREPPTLRTDVGAATGKNLRFGDEAANVLASVAGLIDRATDVMAIRRTKGKGMAANTADLLSWVRDECKRLDSLLSQPVEADETKSDFVTDEEIASVLLGAVARLQLDD